jgi:hypothetical protein
MQPTIERKLRDIQALATDPNSEVFDALSAIDTASSVGSAPRPALEEREVATLTAFLASFSQLSDTLAQIFNAIDSLDQACDSMLTKLSFGQHGVDEVLDMTTSLHAQQEKQQQQLTRIHGFIDEFYLAKSDFDILNAGDINETFFDVFGRLEAAQDRAAGQLRVSQSQCLLDISASLNKAKENAFQRMYKWLHLSSHVFDAPNPGIGAAHTKCLTVIKAKPFLYSLVVERIAKVRGEVVGRVFLKALNTGDGDPKPLEASAGVDPLQFTSDLFAWVHQTTASEAAFLSNLVKEDESSKTVKTAMGSIFESIIRPLENRVSQAIKSLARPRDLYQILNVCAFYAATFGNICGLASPLAKCCDALRLNATKELQTSINALVENTRGGGRSTQAAIVDALQAVQEVATLHKNSALSESFNIGSLIDSYAVGLRASISGCGDAPVFQMNTLRELLTVCSDVNVASKAAVADDLESLFRKFLNSETDELYRRCRVGDLLALMSGSRGRPLSTVHGLEPDLMRAAVKRLESLLVAADSVIAPIVDGIQSSQLQKRAKSEIASRLAETYTMMFNTVTDPANGYDSTGTIFNFTPDHIRAIIVL